MRTTPDMPGNSGEDEGSGDSGVMPSAAPSKDAMKKLDQIIQVVPISYFYLAYSLIFLAEFPYKSCRRYIIFENVPTRTVN